MKEDAFCPGIASRRPGDLPTGSRSLLSAPHALASLARPLAPRSKKKCSIAMQRRYPRPCAKRRNRFIPARAGNSASPSRRRSSCPAYPRRCGEHSSRSTVSPPSSGLSPQARGTPRPYSQSIGGDRFIPAGAGNTGRTIARPPGNTVYPRRCGEHEGLSEERYAEAGSSPQVRGTQTGRGIVPEPILDGSSPQVRGTPLAFV